MIQILLILLLFFSIPAYAQDVCEQVTLHKPVDGVEYVGDAQVPVDINPLTGMIGPIFIPVTVDLADKFNLDFPQGIELKPDVAALRVWADGRVEYNGQDVSGHIEEICARNTDDHGQEAADGVVSSPEIIEVKEGVEGEILEGQHSE